MIPDSRVLCCRDPSWSPAGYTDMWPLATSQGEFHYTLFYTEPKVSLVAQMAKNLPAMWETWVQCLGREDTLEKNLALNPVFLPGGYQGQKNLVGYSPRGCKELDMTEQLSTHTELSKVVKSQQHLLTWVT